MPDITTTTLATGYIGVAYNQTIVAAKVVGIDVERSGSIPDGGSDPLGDVETGKVTPFTYTIQSDGEDDLQITSAAIGGETNCSVSVVTDPGGVLVEPGSDTNLDIEVTPTADGPFSFTITVTSDAAGAEATYVITVTGTGFSYEFWSVLAGGGIGSQEVVENSDVSVEEDGGVGSQEAVVTSVVSVEGGGSIS